MNVLQFGNTNKDLAEKISQEVPKTVQLQDLFDTYPNGVRHGSTFLLGSFSGEAGRSLNLNIDVHSRDFMKGMDFATGQGAGGICKILMEGRGWTFKDCMEHYQQYLPENITPPVENPFNPKINSEEKQTESITEKKIYNLNTPFDSEYTYTDESGAILCVVRKYLEKDSSDNLKKQFRQFVDGRMGLPEPRPLYNIPNIFQNNRVIWVEGEKCADELNALGYTATCTIGGAGMLSERVAHKFDFSPLKNKEVILWPDKDKAGLDLARLVEKLAIDAGAKSTLLLRPPAGKPEKWDVADAIEEDFDIDQFIANQESKIKKSINLLDNSLEVNTYLAGKAPEQKFLIADTIPLGVPVIFAASGDSGKGMMSLDLGMKVASGEGMSVAFGGMISTHGDVVILSAEDDKDEIHRRIERLDPLGKRASYEYDLKILPLPNLGGVFPIMQQVNSTYVMGEEFSKIYDQILEMEDLKLLVIDPMASFVHADVNADPAAGAMFMGMLAQISTETGATVIVNHHMSKIKDSEAISNPEQARNLIRGTSAIVDGVRCAFVIWQVAESIAKKRCKDLGITYARNAIFDGAVVKSNGPVNRDIRNFVRNRDTGLLEDRGLEIQNADNPISERNVERRRVMLNLIIEREKEGKALTKSASGTNAYDVIITELPKEHEARFCFQGFRKSTTNTVLSDLIKEDKAVCAPINRGSSKNVVGVKGGAIDHGVYNPVTARNNL
tara:strand:- start:7897 stop:10074 length:2178 start_codon:yes stop_codon:yes gene_type:complete